MKKFRYAMAILLTAAMGLSSFVACELDENTPEQNQNNNNDNNEQLEPPVEKQYLDYRFIRVDDMTPLEDVTGEDGGADIDAIALIKPDNEMIMPAEVVSYKIGKTGTNETHDPTKVLVLDAFWEYAPSDAKVPTKCRLNTQLVTGDQKEDRTYYSLGGMGGHVAVKLPEGKKIEKGDKVLVFELGDCEMYRCANDKEKGDTKSCGKAGKDSIRVQVSTTHKIEGVWEVIGESTGGVTSIPIVKDLPLVEDTGVIID